MTNLDIALILLMVVAVFAVCDLGSRLWEWRTFDRDRRRQRIIDTIGGGR